MVINDIICINNVFEVHFMEISIFQLIVEEEYYTYHLVQKLQEIKDIFVFNYYD